MTARKVRPAKGTVFNQPCIVGHLLCAIRAIQIDRVRVITATIVAERAAQSIDDEGDMPCSVDELKGFAAEMLRYLWGSA